PDGGSVEIQTHLLIDASAPMVQVSVQDSGIGIPEDARAQVFEPFFTTRRNQGGSGLGMHIVYNLVVQKLQGTIVCESEVGKGTSFTVKIPHESSDE
ncbi:MAG: HAMP domain-containing sensor histidine kinase, partial [Planctomycetota bacterium]|nr:HAMP domain-containing sensor histidine kinase [Planctomycetota bacterium]